MKILDIQNNIKAITACPIFAGMGEDEVISILAEDDEDKLIEVSAGSELDISKMFVIVKGQIVIEKDASDGRVVIMSTAAAPAAVNVAAPLERTSFSRLVAKTDSVLVEVKAETVKRALRQGGTFAVNFAAFLTNRISFLNHKITSLSGYSALSRLELYIEEHKEDDCVVIPDNLSKFAEYLGVGRASLYRAFDTLEESGKIERKGRRIIVKS